MVAINALLLSFLFLTTDVLAGILRYKATYIEDRKHKEITWTNTNFPDQNLQKVLDNMSTWSNGKYKAEKVKKNKKMIIVRNSVRAARKSDTDNMINEMRGVVSRGLSSGRRAGNLTPTVRKEQRY
ncbi:hypothetical protein K461DRAFT_272113 [Myriangium duriaei CBS 260.36]|uniref:Uncharacterized protein n=1 Tax=Myriangium duriaei CBS 260.36 TaxID=1168546 RepID=A0A9P4IW20_9PEZI|nr:hypothetical protein K461DRAFT_272113 [Myriangium duriaei CBS 260.36]